jgi:hypothetical protein
MVQTTRLGVRDAARVSASLAIKVRSQPSAVNGKSAILTFRPFERTGADDEAVHPLLRPERNGDVRGTPVGEDR